MTPAQPALPPTSVAALDGRQPQELGRAHGVETAVWKPLGAPGLAGLPAALLPSSSGSRVPHCGGQVLLRTGRNLLPGSCE